MIINQIIAIDPADSCGVAIYKETASTKTGISTTIKRRSWKQKGQVYKESLGEHVQRVIDFIELNAINRGHVLIEAGIFVPTRSSNAILDEYRGAYSYALRMFEQERIKAVDWKQSLNLPRNAKKEQIKQLYDEHCDIDRGQDEIDAINMIYHFVFGRYHDLDVKEFYHNFVSI